jgi:hypothetical protein
MLLVMRPEPVQRPDPASELPQVNPQTERPAAGSSAERRLLPLVLAYLPVPALGALLSVFWDVGAEPGRTAADLALRGSPLAPPLFLPVLLAGAAAGARLQGPLGSACLAACALVGTAFLAGSTLNLPTDIATARAAGTPIPLTVALAVVHTALALTLLWHALPSLARRLRNRRRHQGGLATAPGAAG